MIIQPILNKFSVSFMAEKDLYDTTIILVPKHFSLNNWKIASILLNYKNTNFFTKIKKNVKITLHNEIILFFLVILIEFLFFFSNLHIH